MRSALFLTLCALLSTGLLTACVPGVGPRPDTSAADAGTADDDAGVDEPPVVRTPLDFEGELVFDDVATRAIDPSTLPAGDAPCRAPTLVWIERAVDGDTIMVREAATGGRERVRIIGVDSPEIEHDGEPADCFGPEAAELTSQLVGHLAWLTFERGCVDRYDRTLAHVHLDDGPAGSWGRQLLRRGYARTLFLEPNVKFESLFESDQRAARNASAGLWRACR